MPAGRGGRAASRARSRAASCGAAATKSRLPRRASDGERARQGEDRPQADEEREERAVLVVEVAAQRADVDGSAGQAGQDGRHGPDDVGQLLARRGRVELGRRWRCVTPMRNRPSTTATAIIARRESRMVLPKTLPRPHRRARADGVERDGCDGRGHRAAMSGCLRRLGAAVLGEERLLERRLAADEVGQLVLRRGPRRPG